MFFFPQFRQSVRLGPVVKKQFSLFSFFLFLAVVGGLFSPATEGKLSGARPPNIVLIISDDHAWMDYGFMAHPAIETPRLDRLAAESLTFTRGYVPSSLCAPSLASIITGRYPHQHKVTGNEPPFPEGVPPQQARRHPDYRKGVEDLVALIDEVPTLPRLLGEKGYLSLQTGKWWHGDYSRGGFTHGMTHGDPARGGRHGDEGLKIGRDGMKPVHDFLEEAGDRPFLIWYAPFLPHTPHDPPERLLNKYLPLTDSIHIARYWAMCEWFDQTCGELLDALDQRGLAEHTMVIFVSDNGWTQPVDRPGGGVGGEYGKRSAYDGGLRTPIMVRWPGKITPRLVNIPVSSLDIAPTVLRACGLEPPPDMPGVNLLDANGVGERRAIFGEVHLHNAVDLRRPELNLTYRWAVADSRWKLILPNRANLGKDNIPKSSGGPELYDLIADPHEERDLAGDQPEVVAELTRLIEEWWPAKP
jgi:arylsulfatase A-like enzyme